MKLIDKFEVVSSAPERYHWTPPIPVRKTLHSAGYDFYTAADTTVHPYTPVLIPTGVKCALQRDHFLQLSLRSSAPKKWNIMLANGIGVIDADYYNNSTNEGEIFFNVISFSDEDFVIPKGTAIGQGVILPFIKTIDDISTEERTGGFGSTDSN